MNATLTPTRIADYLINADLEIQLANYNWEAITYSIAENWPDFEFTPEIIDEAVQLARQDPLIEMSMARFGRG